MKPLTNYRYYLLAILAIVATIGATCEPSDEFDIVPWMGVFLITRIISVMAVIVIVKLWKRWSNDNTIPELLRLTEHE